MQVSYSIAFLVAYIQGTYSWLLLMYNRIIIQSIVYVRQYHICSFSGIDTSGGDADCSCHANHVHLPPASEVPPADESEFDTKELWEATEPPTPLSRSPLWLTLCHLAHARPTMHSIPLVIKCLVSWKHCPKHDVSTMTNAMTTAMTYAMTTAINTAMTNAMTTAINTAMTCVQVHVHDNTKGLILDSKTATAYST